MDLLEIEGSSVANGHKIIQALVFYQHLTSSNIVHKSDNVDRYYFHSQRVRVV